MQHTHLAPLASLALGSLLLLPGAGAANAATQDAERAAHGDLAATPQVTYEGRHGGVTVRQYQLGCLSQLTYLIASGGEALVVDPERDVDHYLRDADQLGAKIRYVALTHTNADFVAGHTELQSRVGAEILISAQSGSEFPHRGLVDGERLRMGQAEFEFLETPGHTLDSMSFLLRVPQGGADPQYAFTGDTLFIGSIGRPDLAQGSVSPAALAQRAFDSLRRLAGLDEGTIVLPAHGAGSLCGAHLSPDTTSTIGRERAENPFLRIQSRAQFVARDVSGLPPAPQYFAHNVALNRRGPPVVDWQERLPARLTPTALAQEIEAGAWVVDLRGAREYAALHVEGSVNVAVRGRLDTWTGSVVPFDASLVLVGSEEEVREAAFRFKRIGLDRVSGFVPGAVEGLRASGARLASAELVASAELARRMAAGTEPIVVDVRTAEEHAELSIGEYAHIDLNHWKDFSRVLDVDQPVLFLCNSAYRSSMAVGLAERQGFRHVASLDGGLDAWIAGGFPVFGTAEICAAPEPPGAPGDSRAPSGPTAGVSAAAAAESLGAGLPEAMEPAALAQGLADQPQSYVLFDLRPAAQFAEYHVPGATSVPPAELAAALARTDPRARVVVLDRDGTLAFAAAALANASLGREVRSVRVLSGGTLRYWREIEVQGGAASATPLPSMARPPVGESLTPALSVPPTKPAAKKRSAGC